MPSSSPKSVLTLFLSAINFRGAIVGLLILSLSLSGCPVNIGAIAGLAQYDAPLADATLNVYSVDSGNLIDTTLTDYDGRWAALSVYGGNTPLRIEVESGQVGGEGFDGHLSAYVPVAALGVDVNQRNIRVDLVSTLIDRYIQNSGVDYTQAEADVAVYLGLEDVAALSDEQLRFAVLDAEAFRFTSTLEGGFDAWMDSLVLEVGTGETLLPPTPDNSFEIISLSFGSWVGVNSLIGLGGAAGSTLAKKLWEKALPALGFETFESQLNRNLEDILSEIEAVQVQVDLLSNKVDTLLTQVNASRDTLINEVVRADTNNAIRVINNQFKNFLALDDAVNPRSAAAQYVSTLPDIDQCVYDIYDAMVGPSSGSTSVLEALTNTLLNEMATSSSRDTKLEEAYASLEYYFGELLAIQAKGAVLMLNVLNYQEAAGNKAYFGSADSYLNNKLRPMLEEEVDVFLYQTERLVAAGADVSTILIGDYNYLPEVAQTIFYRADFIAQQLSAKHGNGLVFRVVGDPDMIEQFITKPAGNAIAGNLTLVPVKGKTIREHKALLPSQYPEDTAHYFSWSFWNWEYEGQQVDGGYHVETETEIAFAKFTFPQQNTALSTALRNMGQVRRQTYTFPNNTKVSARAERLNPIYGAGEVPSGWESDSVVYGNALVPARLRPRMKNYEVLGYTVKKNGNWTVERNYNPISGRMAAKYTLNSKYNRSGWTSNASPRSCNDIGVERLTIGVHATNTISFGCRYDMESKAEAKGFKWAESHGGDKVDGKGNLYFSFDSRWDMTGAGYTVSAYTGRNQSDPDYHQRSSGKVSKSVTESRKDVFSHSFRPGWGDYPNISHWYHIAPKNYVAAHAETMWDAYDDSGSSVHFEHKVKYLEFRPN